MAKQAHLQKGVHPSCYWRGLITLWRGAGFPPLTPQSFSLFFYKTKKMNLRPQVILDPRCAHTCTQPSCPPQPLHKCIFKHHPAWTFFLQLTEYLRSDMLTSTPVDLFRFSSWDTTTCSSFVRWQSSSSMSVPKLTALEMKKLSLNNTWILHRYKPNTGYCIKLIPLEVLQMLSDAMKPHSLAAKQEANNSAAAGELMQE